MKKIGLTGSSGVLATRLKELYPSNEFYEFKGRLENYDEVEKYIISHEELDAVLHLGALVSREIVESEPFAAFNSNVEGTVNILESIRLLKSKKPYLVFASTSHVYSSSNQPINEDSPKEPSSTYGWSKLQCEQWCDIFANRYDLRIAILRLFNFTDTNQSKDFFIPAMIEKIYKAEPDCEMQIKGIMGYRDYLSADQVASALNTFAENEMIGKFNIGTGNPVQLKLIIDKIIVRLNRKDIRVLPDSSDIFSLYADTTKLNKFGITLESELDELLGKMICHFMKSQN